MTTLANTLTIITGASSGIGRACAHLYRRYHSKLLLVDINAEHLDTLIAELNAGDEVLSLVADVTNEADMENMAQQAVARFGRIDTLIASAGILRLGGLLKTVHDMSYQEWNRVLQVNLTGTFLSNRAVLPTMMAQKGGDIINISSTSGRQAHAFDSAYAASKFGVIGLSEALAEEVSGFGVRVQTVLPDAVDTPIWEQNGPAAMRAQDNLTAERVAEFIYFMNTLPRDSYLLNPIIAPMKTRKRRGKKQKSTDE